MSHRENSLTPHILPDGFIPTHLPEKVYDDAVAQGCDMTYFVRGELPPGEVAKKVTFVELKDRDCIRRTGSPCTRIPASLYEKASVSGADMRDFVIQELIPPIPGHGNHGRKFVSDKMCGGKETPCLPGKDGKCVACADED